jgi:pimeloyl-ACP methyl ester carboxylesterase
MQMESLSLGNGESLEFCQSGPQDSEALLVFHVGTPCAAAEFPNVASAAAARGVRTVSYSRAGYGGSTRSPGRTVADEARNTAALADHLAEPTFLVAGWSGGGPAALACAALLPDRVGRCAVLASSSPPGEVGEAWFDWCEQKDCEEVRAMATSSPDPFVTAYQESAISFATMTPRTLAELPGTPGADREAFERSPGLAEALADSMRRAVASGVDGWIDDAVALARPWGFKVSGIKVPVTIRHGELDNLVRVEHGRWLAEHIPSAKAEIVAGHGHTSVADPFDGVMDGLLEPR